MNTIATDPSTHTHTHTHTVEEGITPTLPTMNSVKTSAVPRNHINISMNNTTTHTVAMNRRSDWEKGDKEEAENTIKT